jgi:hypothetical protein
MRSAREGSVAKELAGEKATPLLGVAVSNSIVVAAIKAWDGT